MPLWSRATLLFLVLFSAACGAQYETKHVMDYRIYVDGDSQLVESVNYLMDDFNDEFGDVVLEYVNDREEANSFVRFKSGMRDRENKLGLGQWITVTTEEGADLLPRNQKLDRTVVYSMEIDFDYENFKSKSRQSYDRDSSDWAHLYHLFCHEIGHGLQMDHSSRRLSVMYPSIPEASLPNLDYSSFFDRARTFFAKSTNIGAIE